jgi:hypothetical protein
VLSFDGRDQSIDARSVGDIELMGMEVRGCAEFGDGGRGVSQAAGGEVDDVAMSASWRATSRPIPRLAPVTTAMRFIAEASL